MPTRWLLPLLCTVLAVGIASAADAQPTRARIGQLAPSFDLPVVQGKASGKLSDYRGRVVVLKFWATYCGWCKKIRPDLVKLARDHKDDIAVLAISSQGTGKLKRYLRRHTIGLPVLHDRRSPVRRAYRANATPTLVVLDRCGVVRYARAGMRAKKSAIATALALAAESAESCVGGPR